MTRRAILGALALCGLTIPALAQPANDDCSGAIPITCGSVAGSTGGATVDFPTGGSPLLCGNTGDRGEYHDRAGVWYTYVGTGAPVQFSTCNAGTGFDTQIIVFDGACGSLNCVAGNDDLFAACSFSGLRSAVTINAAAGTTYTIMVCPWATGSFTGSFTLDVNCSLPLGVSCNAPNPNPVGQGGNTLLTAVVTPASNPTSTGITVSIDLSAVGGSGSQAMFDNGTNGDVTPGDGVYSFDLAVSAAATPGNYALGVNVSDAQGRSASCNTNLSITFPPPANDDCGSAQAITSLPFSTSFDNSDATPDGIPGSCNTFSATTMQNSVWFSYTPSASGPYDLLVDNQGAYDAIVVISEGGCGAQTEIACGDEPEPIEVSLNLVAGTNYLIQVGDWGSFPGGGVTTLQLVVGGVDVTCDPVTPVLPGASTTISATVAPAVSPPSTGITVTADASALGLSSISMLDNGVPPDATAGDNIFSATVAVGSGATPGNYTLPVAVTDAQGRTANCALNLLVSITNDDCSAAISVACGASVIGGIAGASVDFPTGGSILPCANSPDQAEYHDRNGVWYSIVGTGQSLRLSTCNATTTFDTQIVVFDGACGSLNCVAGNDDAFASCGTSGLQSIVTFNSTAGTTYYVMVCPWGIGVASGTFQLDVLCDLPLEVTCNAAVPAAVGQGGNALISARVSPGTNPASTGITVTLDLSSIGGPSAQPMFDDGSNGDVTAGDLVYSLDATVPASAPLGAASLPVNVADGQGRNASCSVGLNVLPPPATNDDCANAIAVSSIPFTATFSNVSSTPDGIPGSCNSGSATTMQNSVWFSFTPTITQDYRVTALPSGYDAILLVSTGDCTTQTEVACFDGPESGVVNMTAGTTYLIQIGDWGLFPGGGATTFLVDVFVPLTNDDCANPTPITSLPFTVLVDNSTATADGIPGSCNSTTATTMQNSVWYSFTPATTGLYDLSVDNGGGYDAIVIVSEGGCAAQSEIACGDEPEPIAVSVTLNAGTTYLIQLGDWGVAVGGGPTTLSLTSQIGIGACCLGPSSTPAQPPRTCTQLTAAACVAAGGRYQGDGSPCTPQRSCCWGDIDGDFDTDESDLGLLLQSWQVAGGGDLDGDNDTDESDLGLLLQNWNCRLAP